MCFPSDPRPLFLASPLEVLSSLAIALAICVVANLSHTSNAFTFFLFISFSTPPPILFLHWKSNYYNHCLFGNFFARDIIKHAIELFRLNGIVPKYHLS